MPSIEVIGTSGSDTGADPSTCTGNARSSDTKVDVSVAALSISRRESGVDCGLGFVSSTRTGTNGSSACQCTSAVIQSILDACHAAARSHDLIGVAAEIRKLEASIDTSINNDIEQLGVDANNENRGPASTREYKERQDSLRYDVASSLIRLGLCTTVCKSMRNSTTCSAEKADEYLATIQSRVDRCLDLCGPANSFLAAVNVLRGDSAGDQVKMITDASAGQEDTSQRVSSDRAIVVSAIYTARRVLFSGPLENELAADSATPDGNEACILPLYGLCKDFYELSSLQSDNSSRSSSQVHEIMYDLARRSILLPVSIGSACHRAKLNLPTWAIRDRYCRRLVEIALETAQLDSKEVREGEAPLTMLYFRCVLDMMVRNGAADSVVLGLHKFWSRRRFDKESPDTESSFTSMIGVAISSISSSRDCATLLRSAIRFTTAHLDSEHLLLLRKRSGIRGEATVWSATPMVFLRQVCLPVLRASEEARESFFRLVVLSPAPSSSAAGSGETDIRWMVIPRIAASLFFALSHDQGGVDNRNKFLLQSLLEASETWGELSFIRLTDEMQQLYVTEFIMASIVLLDKNNVDTVLPQDIVVRIVQGVTLRLESSNLSIRKQGMRVAELLAPILGQTLRFAELDGVREVSDEPVDDRTKHDESLLEGQRLSAPVQNDMNDDDDNSVWSQEDLTPYDLNDDEDDLAAVKQPRYLRDCLALLRTTSTDKNAFDSVEAALKHIAPLVRTEPPDLPDLAQPLAKELLHAEDKFSVPNFASLRWDGLLALTVHEPIAVSGMFTDALFESVSLGVRLDILGLLEHAADDLCGAAALRADRNACRELLLGPDRQTKVSGKRRFVQDELDTSTTSESEGLVCSKHSVVALEHKTRRWGRGRRQSQPKTATNRFGQLAPMWFYPLVAGWIRSKDDKSVWGGANGARFFSSFLVALAKILESAGNYPCTVVLASDLFELAWPFRNADSPEIRAAVLVTIATCCQFLHEEFFAACMNKDEGLATFLRAAALHDSDSTCRQIAAAVAKNITSNAPALGGCP